MSYADELPDLAALRQARAERVAPERIGEALEGPVAPPKKPKAKRRVMLAGRSLAALFAVLALAMTGGAWQWQSAKNNMLNRISALDPNSRDIVDPNAQYGDENFLIVGVDSRYGKNADMGAGNTEDAGGTRSDTIMLVNIPANRKRVVAVSFPRDLNIEPMKCEAWNPETGEYGPLYDDQTGTYGPDEVYTETKLNSAYSFGGPKCLVKVIQKLSGLSINRFMAVDFAGFSKMVDALGGVEVCSTTPLEDYELGTVLANAGRQMIDGHTALQYVRARQVTTETNGDYGRIKRQQLFLSSLLRSLISKEVFFSLNKLNDVVNMFINDSYVDNIGTKDLVELGQSLQDVAAGRITFVTVPTTGYIDEWGNEHLRAEDNRAIFDAIINDDPLPEEKNADNTPVPGTPESMTNQTPESPTSEAPKPEATTEASEVVDAVTTEPIVGHRAGVEFDGPGRAGRHRGQRTPTARLQGRVPRRLPRPGGLHDRVLLAGQRGGRRHRGIGVLPPDHRARQRQRQHRAGGARTRLFGREPAASRAARRCRSTCCTAARAPRRNCPRTCRSPTPPTPPANSRNGTPAMRRVWAVGIHLSFTMHVVTIHRISP